MRVNKLINNHKDTNVFSIPLSDGVLRFIKSDKGYMVEFDQPPCGYDGGSLLKGEMSLEDGCKLQNWLNCDENLKKEDVDAVVKLAADKVRKIFKDTKERFIDCAGCGGEIKSGDEYFRENSRWFFHKKCLHLPDNKEIKIILNKANNSESGKNKLNTNTTRCVCGHVRATHYGLSENRSGCVACSCPDFTNFVECIPIPSFGGNCTVGYRKDGKDHWFSNPLGADSYE